MESSGIMSGSAAELGGNDAYVSKGINGHAHRPSWGRSASWTVGHHVGQFHPPEILGDKRNSSAVGAGNMQLDDSDSRADAEETSPAERIIKGLPISGNKSVVPRDAEKLSVVQEVEGPDEQSTLLGNQESRERFTHNRGVDGDSAGMADSLVPRLGQEPQLPSTGRPSNSLMHRPMRSLSIHRRIMEPSEMNAKQSTPAPWLQANANGCRGRIGLPEIRLDLKAVQRSRDISEPTELQMRRDKFAYFEKACSRVLEHVYLGSDVVARNLKTLQASEITHVLNCVGYVCPEYFPDKLAYKTLWLQDNPGEDITSVLYDVFDYLESVRNTGGRVFVHCCQGVSRSTSLVIAYVMWLQGRTFEDAFRRVKEARGVTNPNMGFACQLLQWQKRVQRTGSPTSPRARLYRMAPHSPYDPLHLVPKPLSKATKAGLDPRGAFVLQMGPTVYSWRGCESDEMSGSAADVAAEQIVRYEKLEGPVVHAREGDADSGFWKVLDLGEGCGSTPLGVRNAAQGEELPREAEGSLDADGKSPMAWRRASTGMSAKDSALNNLLAGRKGVATEGTPRDELRKSMGGHVAAEVSLQGLDSPRKRQARLGGWSGVKEASPSSPLQWARKLSPPDKDLAEGHQETATASEGDGAPGRMHRVSRSVDYGLMKWMPDTEEGKEGGPGPSSKAPFSLWDTLSSMGLLTLQSPPHTPETSDAGSLNSGQEWRGGGRMKRILSCGNLDAQGLADKDGSVTSVQERWTCGGVPCLAKVAAYDADFEALAKAQRGEAPRPQTDGGGSVAILPARSSGWERKVLSGHRGGT